MIEYLLFSKNAAFWFFVLIGILFILWVFIGGRNVEFVGLKPLAPGQRISPYLPPSPSRVCFPSTEQADDTELVLSSREDPAVVDTTPSLPSFLPPEIPLPERIPESQGEQRCRQVMEEIYHVPFVRVRPSFLRNPETGYPLELDAYNERLKLAVEYNGSHHYLWPNYTNQTYEAFVAQARRDLLKVELCDRNGVYLITVPYNVPLDKIRDYIVYYLPENVERRRKLH